MAQAASARTRPRINSYELGLQASQHPAPARSQVSRVAKAGPAMIADQLPDQRLPPLFVKPAQAMFLLVAIENVSQGPAERLGPVVIAIFLTCRAGAGCFVERGCCVGRDGDKPDEW
eukprot:scaffold238823_cov28-Prasinocladus_malaysianus.AAC.1